MGLILCAVLLYVIEYLLTAPNESTLFYRQSWWALGALILFVISVAALAPGIWRGIQGRRAK